MHDKLVHLDFFQSFATEDEISQESVMDFFVVLFFASLFQVIGQVTDNILCLLAFSHIYDREVFPS